MSETKQRETIKGMLREPSIPEMLKHRRQDAEFLSFLTRPGGKGELPYCHFKCSIHGYVENYP
jgi:hypothetical protein